MPVRTNVTTYAFDASSDSRSVTVPADCEVLELSIAAVGGGISQASVTVGGQDMATEGTSIHSSGKPRIRMWRLSDPPTGSQTVVVTMTGGAADKVGVAVNSWTDIDTAAPFDSVVGTEATDADPTSGTVTSASGNLVADAVANASTLAYTADGGNTELYDFDVLSSGRGAGSTEDGAASVVTSWSVGESKEWALLAWNANAPAAGPEEGGRYLLESGAPDGYLLEDGSGVLMMEGDPPGGGTPHSQPVDDALGITDVVTLAVGLGIADPLAVADVLVSVATFERMVADPLGVTDAVALGHGRSADDLLDITDQADATILKLVEQNDALGVTDAVVFDRGLGLADGLGVADALASVAVFQRQVVDGLGVTDAQPLARTLALADALGVTDQVSPLIVLLTQLADVLAITDAQTLVRGYGRQVDDALAVTDQTVRAAAMVRALDDSLAVADALALVRALALADVLAVADHVQAGEGIQAVADMLAITDAITIVLRVPWTGQTGDSDLGATVGTADRGTIGRADVGSTRRH